MADESLDKLTEAFDAWRSRKRHAREGMPADLVERARAAARRHGPAAVSRATGVSRGRLVVRSGNGMERRSSVAVSVVPAYSRVDVAAPAMASSARLFAEVEMPSGVKVRLFNETGGALGLLLLLVGADGAR